MGPNSITAIVPYQPINFYDLAVQETKKTLEAISEELYHLDLIGCHDPQIYQRVKEELNSIIRRCKEASKGFETVLADEIAQIQSKIEFRKVLIRQTKIDETARNSNFMTSRSTFVNGTRLFFPSDNKIGIDEHDKPMRTSSPIREYHSTLPFEHEWLTKAISQVKDLMDKRELPNSHALEGGGYDNWYDDPWSPENMYTK